MKSSNKRIIVVLFLVAVAITYSSFEFSHAQPVTENAPLPDDLVLAGQNADVPTGGIKGDAILAGANVNVLGNVQGYAILAGANVTVNAPVGNDLLAAGATINVNAPVADNAMIAGSNISLMPTATIGKDARIAGSQADIRGRITRNLRATAANVQISSEVGGNAIVYAESVTLNPGAVINGDLVVYSPNEPVISPQATVKGRVDYHKAEGTQAEKSYANSIASWVLSLVWNFLWLAVLGLTAILFSSKWTNNVAEMIKNSPGPSVLTGLIAVLLGPIVFILLLVTILGIPLALILAAFYLVAYLLSGVFVSYLIGGWALQQIKRWTVSNPARILAGALIVAFVVSLPWIGFIGKLAIVFFGVGAFILERRGLFRQLRAQGLA